MASTDGGTVEGPRPFIITSSDHRGVVLTLAILFILYASMVLGMRMAARMRSIGLDDVVAALATAFSIAQLGTLIGAVGNTFGASFARYNGNDESVVANTLRACDILLLISLFVTKCSVIILCRRLFSVNQKLPRVLCEVLLGLSTVWCLASILTITISCNAKAAIGLKSGKCSGLVARWTVVGTLDAILEVAILVLSVLVIWPLQMSVSRRLQAMSCFIARLPIVVFIGLHIYYLRVFQNSSNKGVALEKPYIFRECELLYSLFSAGVPALNQYLRKFQTTGASTFGYNPTAYGGHSYGLKSLSRSSKKQNSATDSKNEPFDPRPRGNYLATTETGVAPGNDGSQDEISRHDSQDMIIRKDVLYEVYYADSDGNGQYGAKPAPHAM